MPTLSSLGTLSICTRLGRRISSSHRTIQRASWVAVSSPLSGNRVLNYALSWRSSIGNPLPSGRCGAVRALRTGSCLRLQETTTRANNGCAACSARQWRTIQSLSVRSTRTIPVMRWTRWRSTTRSAMASRLTLFSFAQLFVPQSLQQR